MNLILIQARNRFMATISADYHLSKKKKKNLQITPLDKFGVYMG